MNARISNNEDLNVESKFTNMMGGYQCLNEKSYLLLVDISKDSQKRQEEMDIDGGDLDDDTIEREWWQITVLSSLPIQDGETDGK